VLLLLAIAAAAATSNAQERTAPLPAPLFGTPAVLDALGDLDPAPGSWADYQVRARSGESLRVRVSVLSDPAPQGRYWLEVDTNTPGLPAEAARLLLRGSPSRPRNVERLEIYVRGQAPIEIPVDDLEKEIPSAAPGRKPRIRRRGQERVQVPAGSFAADVIDVGGTRVWRSSRVPLWGLVKERSARHTVELVGSGREGAHSAFPPDDRHGKGRERTK
jgi:hypothetical protein